MLITINVNGTSLWNLFYVLNCVNGNEKKSIITLVFNVKALCLSEVGCQLFHSDEINSL
jgi:hypothetical protein